jgi:hypothetical protein
VGSREARDLEEAVDWMVFEHGKPFGGVVTKGSRSLSLALFESVVFEIGVT